ncbi:MAG: rRNA maturation RNase YbeY [Deltaproteobacteria bacterium]|nr:rRNA maturation RNase YbeY [Deltaproteobacteria bacterium]MBW2019166.1 rRNA maturation RNase YbeY [Deltaproteobacteria bacterium]MBW2073969.1 rRNA maturation RNase YbeY [Deltaproteobacteria bacterium]RLB81231.1 MAG: rRNA maturation RNase YbeY [Deltaproteobacteria bacterium]
MEILIEDRQDRYRLAHEEIKRKAKIILNALGCCPDGELSILVVGDRHIAELNKTYLGRSGPTNVIAFPMQEGPFGQINPNLLGDVVISLDTAAREAQDAGLSLESRFNELLIHGILHLFGFDHEKTPEDAERMANKTEELLELLGESRSVPKLNQRT